MVTERDGGPLDQLPAMRVGYSTPGLHESELAADPLTQFAAWLADAERVPLPEPNAVTVATAAVEDGVVVPTARNVLLKGVDAGGFVFYTNLRSRKAMQIAANPHVSLAFPWFPMQRQVLVTGVAAEVDRSEVADYFRRRPYGARIGAWASRQSVVLASSEVLARRYAQLQQRYPDTGSPDDVPVPPFWGGFRVAPVTVEFWAGRPSRLHDRLRYRSRSGAPAALDDPAAWVVERLSP